MIKYLNFNLFSTKNFFFKQCRCKTTALFQPLNTRVLNKLIEMRLNGKNKAFSIDFLRIRNKEYQNISGKITRLRSKKMGIPFGAVKERQLIDSKIAGLKESRSNLPSRV